MPAILAQALGISVILAQALGVPAVTVSPLAGSGAGWSDR
jgi:hypothetical protein